MYPRTFATSHPNKLAVIMEPSGKSLSYERLERESNQAAHFFRRLGLEAGDVVAFALENTIELFVFIWGAQRAGLIYVPISSRLKPDEIAYIVSDSGTKLVLASNYIGAESLNVLPQTCDCKNWYTTGDAEGVWRSWSASLADLPDNPIADERRGVDMLYSSGTTGQPKGIIPQYDSSEPYDAPDRLTELLSGSFGVDEHTQYLCPAPLYHAAPLRWCCSAQRLGATVIVMEKFDAEMALRLIQEHRVTHAQFVPTHFIRMLKLDRKARESADVSSLRFVVHAAAPCPIPVKETMLEWWGPVINEYYAGSEGNGMTFIGASDWLTHKGSVGRPVSGGLHICDESGESLATGEEGLVYFETPNAFSYHNAPEKTAETRNALGWTTLGDIGRLDEDGFLYLTDRKSFMIISGGVNIYPQEIENRLIIHPDVADVAVIGAPDPDMGERVVAVVQPTDFEKAGAAFAEELEAFCRETLSGVKIPRQIDFRQSLPRADTGKLYKRLIRDEYWADTSGTKP